MKEKFKISSEAHGSFKYIGLEVTQNEHGVFLHQDKYVKSVQSATISTERKKHKEDELSEEEKLYYHQLVENYCGHQLKQDRTLLMMHALLLIMARNQL